MNGLTRTNLTRIYYLSRELEMWERRLEELEADIPPNSKPSDGMPHSTTNAAKSPTEDKAIRLAELTEKIKTRKAYIEAAKMEIESLIINMEDPILKLAIEYHCINLLSWKATATRIGGNQTPEGLRKMYSRFFKTLTA